MPGSFLTELRRRKVVRTAVLYAALGWGSIEVVSTVGQIFGWADWIVRAITIVIILGLPVAIVVSWMFDLTPDGFLPEAPSATPGVTPTDDARGVGSSEGRPAGGSGPARPGGAAVRITARPPHPATPILGRDEALATASERLDSGARVLTITGTGGTGKTRFAVELFDRLHPGYPDGAAFVSLASIEAADDVMPTVCSTLDVAEAHGRSAVDALATVIANGRVLLVLDNLEQVLGAANEIAALASRCPQLQIVATSRAPLKIGAEVELPLPPLQLPPADVTAAEDLSLYPAIDLFVQRAKKVKPDFSLRPENADAILGICRRLDGLPLALELAAARIRILGPSALLDRLGNALDVLTSGDRDLPERQRTLRATVNWSYDLLDEDEQALLRRLSCFAEGWTYEAMEAVCYDEANRSRALDELDSLVEKGLVQVTQSGNRYSLLVTIRDFASDALESLGEARDALDAHADYFVDFSRRVHEGICGRGQLDAMRRSREDGANTDAALAWLTGQARAGDDDALEKALLVAGYQNWVWHITGQHMTARAAVDAVLALAEDRPPTVGRAYALSAAGMVSVSTDELARGLDEWTASYEDGKALGHEASMAQAGVGIGFTHVVLGQLDDARVVLEETIERSERIDEPFMQAVATLFLGTIHGVSGELDRGLRLVTDALEICEEIDDYEGKGVGLSFLASLHFMGGDVDLALDRYRDALDALETVGDRPEIARVHGEMGWAALSIDRLAEAKTAFLNSVRWYDEVGSARGVGTAMLGLAVAEAQDGRTERAVTIAAAADVMAEQAGVVVVHAMGIGAPDRIEAIRSTFSEDDLARLSEVGRALSPGEVLAMVAEAEPYPVTV